MKVINLLPQSEQKAIVQERLYKSFLKFLIASIVLYALFIAALFGLRTYIQSTLANLDVDIKKNQALIDRQDNDEIRKLVLKNNGTITDYISLYKNNPIWSNVLTEFAKLVPTDAIITSMSVNTKTGKIDILGFASNRDASLALRSNISNSKLFKNINLPLENLQKPIDTPFTYTFYLADGALKP